ncbi:MAG: histidine phosphatase family protein, partial [Chloroflexi bacterium]|nr:histidine phosphatase family protein [Chloroflexota bacterium]
MTRLLLVRHGISEFNMVRRFAGYSDVEMNAAGYEQVGKLRDRLAGEKINAVYSSDLKRAVATAEIISAACNVDIVTCSELREVNYGSIEGLTFQEIKDRYPDIAELITNFSLEQLSFPGGESFTDFIERTSKFVSRLEKHAPEQTVLIVSHSGPLRVLVCHLLGLGMEHWRQIRLDNASLSIIETYPQRTIISLLNDTSH